jgi:hypothetical protein
MHTMIESGHPARRQAPPDGVREPPWGPRLVRTAIVCRPTGPASSPAGKAILGVLPVTTCTYLSLLVSWALCGDAAPCGAPVRTMFAKHAVPPSASGLAAASPLNVCSERRPSEEDRGSRHQGRLLTAQNLARRSTCKEQLRQNTLRCTAPVVCLLDLLTAGRWEAELADFDDVMRAPRRRPPGTAVANGSQQKVIEAPPAVLIKELIMFSLGKAVAERWGSIRWPHQRLPRAATHR